jgi:hypothetical protein
LKIQNIYFSFLFSLKKKSKGELQLLNAMQSLGKTLYTQVLCREANKPSYKRSMQVMEYSTLATNHTPIGVFMAKYDVNIVDSDSSIDDLSQDMTNNTISQQSN